jgi:hypothetical protein
MQKKDDEGSKAHSKRGKVRKCTTQEVRAQRRTKKEGEGSKAHLEKKVGPQRCTQKEGEGSKPHSK